MGALRLRVALRRGALITLANWPLVIAEFAADALMKASLGVPVVGGAIMVTALAGRDMGALLSNGLRDAAGGVIEALTDAPAALTAFIAAFAIVAIGAAALTFLVQAGSLAVFVAAERRAPGELNAGSIRNDAMRQAKAATLEVFLGGVRAFGLRMVSLGALLLAAYALAAGIVGAVTLALYRVAEAAEWISAFPIVALAATGALVVLLTAINLVYVLTQLVIASDDCGVGAAVRRVRRFLVYDARQVAGIFGVMFALMVGGAVVSVIVTAALGLVAWVPVVGIIVFPLQAAAWLARGLVFQLAGLTTLVAYIAQYRRYVEQE
jgi:hypothetical protein